jgi:Zn finger protein HypA/HybF involved in hydrogenase expression
MESPGQVEPPEFESTLTVQAIEPPRFRESELYSELCTENILPSISFPWALRSLVVAGLACHSSGVLYPTLKGILILQFVRSYFKRLVQNKYIEELEGHIIGVSSGEERRVDILRQFYRSLQFDAKQLDDVIYSKILYTEKCPKCHNRNLSVYFPDVGEPYLFCDDSVKRNKGCGFTAPPDIGPKGSLILFESKEVEGKCPKCGMPSTFKTAAGKQGFYMRCINCNSSIRIDSHANKDISKAFD